MKLVQNNSTNAVDHWVNLFRGSLGDLEKAFTGFPQFESKHDLPVDLYQNEDAYYALFEVPGFKREELDTTLDSKGVLTISTKSEDDSKSFKRSVRLGDRIDAEGITAKLDLGILTVTVPKAEAAKPRTITIE